MLFFEGVGISLDKMGVLLDTLGVDNLFKQEKPCFLGQG